MHLKLIACNVFQREACYCLARSAHTIDTTFAELGEHAESDRLREKLQGWIDAAEASPKQYDAILLLYGLCGNATLGLTAGQTKLVIPRAHDCCTILLGSTQTFKEHFQANPSKPFSSVGYMERGDYYLRTADGDLELCFEDPFKAYVDQYGEENAKFIWDSMHPEHLREATHEAVYIELPETGGLGHAERFAAQAEAEGKTVVNLQGSIRLIRNLIAGDWAPEDFLVVPPHQRIGGVYDWDEVIRAEAPKG